MKIYTKINYKWLDGQLVKTSSKSFEYEGDLTLCGGGGGGGDKGGGGGGGGTLGAITSSVSDTVTDVATDPIGSTSDALTEVITDPVGTVTDALGDTADTVGGSIAEGTGIVGDNIQTGVEMTANNLEDGVAGMGMNDGVATTLGDMGAGIHEGVTSFGDKIVDDNFETWINEGVDKVHDFGKDVNDIVSDEMGRWQDFAHEKLGAGGSSGSTVELDKLSSFKANKLKKIKAELGSNTAKSRARSSLRIG